MTNGNNHNDIKHSGNKHEHHGDVRPQTIFCLINFQLMSNNTNAFNRSSKLVFIMAAAMIVSAIAASKKKKLKIAVKMD